MGIKDGLKKFTDGVKEKKKNVKMAWELTKPTVLAKRFSVPVKRLRVVSGGNVIFDKKDFKATMVRYKKASGIAIKVTNKQPVRYQLAKQGQLRTTDKNIEYDHVPVDYEVWFGKEDIKFIDCEANVVKYKGVLMDLELPFGDDGSYISKEGELKIK